jgi:hypothetical protein
LRPTPADFPLRQAHQSTIVNAYCPDYTEPASAAIDVLGCGSAVFLALLDAAGDVWATGDAINVNLPSNGQPVSVLKSGPGIRAWTCLRTRL